MPSTLQKRKGDENEKLEKKMKPALSDRNPMVPQHFESLRLSMPEDKDVIGSLGCIYEKGSSGRNRLQASTFEI